TPLWAYNTCSESCSDPSPRCGGHAADDLICLTQEQSSHSQTMDDRRWTMGHGLGTMNDGRWIMDWGRRMMGNGWRIKPIVHRPSSIVRLPPALAQPDRAVGVIFFLPDR